MLYRNVLQDDHNKDELLHLKSKIKDIGLSSFRLKNKKTIGLKIYLKKYMKLL